MRIILLAVALAVGGCDLAEPGADLELDVADEFAWASVGRTCVDSEPARALSPGARDSLPADVTVDVNTRWAAIARRVPGGWGGYWLDEARGTIYLVHPSQREAASAALVAEGIPAAGAAVRQGRWDFAQLYDWYRYLRPHLGRIQGVYQSDIQESRNRLQYAVEDDAVKAKVEETLSRLSTPCWLVALRVAPNTTSWD